MKRPSLISIKRKLIAPVLAIAFSSQASAQTAARAEADFEPLNPLNDGQILQIVRTLNEGEIKLAELALVKSDSQDVQHTALAIIEDHSSSNQAIESLDQSGLQLQDSAWSERLQGQAREIHEQLEGQFGEAFDCAYLQTQVEQHRFAIDITVSTLEPYAMDIHVEDFLAALTPILEHHLLRAQGSLEDLEGCDSPAPSETR